MEVDMLNDTLIRSLKAMNKPQKHFDGGGLFLFIPQTGSKLWRMAYRYDGKSKLLSFGAYPTVSLKEARERKEDAKRLLSKGIDPGVQKKQLHQDKLAAEHDSFKNIALEWYANQTADLTAKHRMTVMFRLENYLFKSRCLVPCTSPKWKLRTFLPRLSPLSREASWNLPPAPTACRADFSLCNSHGKCEAQYCC